MYAECKVERLVGVQDQGAATCNGAYSDNASGFYPQIAAWRRPGRGVLWASKYLCDKYAKPANPANPGLATSAGPPTTPPTTRRHGAVCWLVQTCLFLIGAWLARYSRLGHMVFYRHPCHMQEKSGARAGGPISSMDKYRYLLELKHGDMVIIPRGEEQSC
ncbi:hypothetical protein F4859DRAFT_302153 [Xylaria cf. heliscus]|nr:hypothetical protein F4859DRAFT_302153 [Xylaria cf. heliscus]